MTGRLVRCAGWVGLGVLVALGVVSCGGAGVPARGPLVASAGPQDFRPGQYWYTRTISSQREWLSAGGITIDRRGYTHRHGPHVLFDLRVSEETWVGVDGTFRDRTVVAAARFASAAGRAKWAAYGRPRPDFNHLWMGWTANDVIALGADTFPPALPYHPSEWTGPGGRDIGDGLFTYRRLVSLPSTPAALRGRLRQAEKALARRHGTEGYAVIPQTNALGQLSDIAALLTSPLPASARLALFHAAVTMPGARVNPRARDSLGRRGLSVTATADETLEQLIFDPETGALLGEAPNVAVVAQGVVDSAYALPKGVSPIRPVGAPPKPPTIAISPRVGNPNTRFKVMLPSPAGRRLPRPPALDWVLLGTASARCFFDGFAEVLRPLRAAGSIRRAGRPTYVYRLGPPPTHGHTWCPGRYALGVVPDYSGRPHAPNPNSALPDWFSEGARGSWIIFGVS